MCGRENDTVGPNECPAPPPEDVIEINEEEAFAFAFISEPPAIEVRKMPVVGGGEVLGCSVFTTAFIMLNRKGRR